MKISTRLLQFNRCQPVQKICRHKEWDTNILVSFFCNMRTRVIMSATPTSFLPLSGESLAFPCQGEYREAERGCSPPMGRSGGVSYIGYNRGLTEYAQHNRKNPTNVEKIFWHLVLKKKNFLWYRFRRQKIINSFILDFYCPELLLWIELDGWYHKDRVDYDRYRDAEIYKKWVLIVRFKNEEIEKNLVWVISELEEIIKERREMIIINS